MHHQESWWIFKKKKKSNAKHGSICWSGQDGFCNMQMILLNFCGCSQSPSYPMVLQSLAYKNKNVWFLNKL